MNTPNYVRYTVSYDADNCLVAQIPDCLLSSGVKLQLVSANLENAAESTFECIFESTFEPLSGSQSAVNFESAAERSFEWISIRSKLASNAFLVLTPVCVGRAV